jgi:hypothetical protein
MPNCSSTSCDLGIFVYQSTGADRDVGHEAGKATRGWERLERCRWPLKCAPYSASRISAYFDRELRASSPNHTMT